MRASEHAGETIQPHSHDMLCIPVLDPCISQWLFMTARFIPGLQRKDATTDATDTTDTTNATARYSHRAL